MTHFEFLYPLWLLGLIPVILISGFYMLRHEKTRLRSHAANSLLAPHIAQHFHITQATHNRASHYLITLIFILMLLSLSGPSWHKVNLPTYTSSGARVLAIQLSNSMNSTDITPSRLAQARYKALDLLPLWKEGETGLLGYAGDAFMISPMTKDAATLATQIKVLDPSIMPYTGNNTFKAIQASINLLKDSGHSHGDIILITDGVSAENRDKILTLDKKHHWRISVLAVSTQAGAPILDMNGHMLTDAQGHTQISQLRAAPLQALAKETGGVYVPISATESDISQIAQVTTQSHQNAVLSQKKIETRANDGYWLLFPIALLSLWLTRSSGLMLLCLLCFMPKLTYANPLLNADVNAYKDFAHKHYSQAAKKFQDPAWKGIAQYQAKDYKNALTSFSQAKDVTSLYNLGNTYAQLGQYEKAIETYKKVLLQDKDNLDAKKNLDLLEKMQQKQQAQSSPSQQSQQTKQKQESGSQQKQSSSAHNHQQGSQKKEKKSSQKKSATPSSQQSQQGQKKNSQGASEQKQQQAEQQIKKSLTQAQQAKKNNSEQVKTSPAKSSQDGLKQKSLSQVRNSDPIMRKLEQIPEDPRQLIRAQILREAQERQAQENR